MQSFDFFLCCWPEHAVEQTLDLRHLNAHVTSLYWTTFSPQLPAAWNYRGRRTWRLRLTEGHDGRTRTPLRQHWPGSLAGTGSVPPRTLDRRHRQHPEIWLLHTVLYRYVVQIHTDRRGENILNPTRNGWNFASGIFKFTSLKEK